MFEETGLFVRGVGEGTDIVDKEMYTFQDKGGHSLTLRPEGTAPAVRAYLEHGMRTLPQPVKLYYLAPNFRYERPQAGRYRQHHQFGVEVFGEMDPSLDAEVIDLAMAFYGRLGVTGLSMQLNSIGCPECRPAYLERLTAYYRDHVADACGDCRRRLEINPLRLLDCKVPSCQPVIDGAPQIAESLCEACAAHFAALKGHLAALDIGYAINPRLVRGFNYYTKTIFELWAQGIGAQSAVGGGGRYDGLIEELGGPPTPGIGFGIGLERAILTMKEQGVALDPGPGADIFVVAVGEAARGRVVGLVNALRRKGLAVASVHADRSLKAQMRAANASGARRVVILGEEEMRREAAVVKDMGTGAQEGVPVGNLVEYLVKS
jgi:histidyl-tRNA synthetase